MKEFKLPEKWAVKITYKNRNELINWVKDQPDYDVLYDDFPVGEYVVSKWHDRSYQFWDDSKAPDNYTEITFEQFKQHVLKEEIMERKIIGYKLKDKGNEFFAVKMVQVRANDKSAKTFKELTGLNEEYDFQGGSLAYNTFNDIGLLNEWFEPVYEKIEFNVGDWVWHYNCKTAYKITELDGHHFKAEFGPAADGGNLLLSFCRYATTEEIKAALLAEAARRYPVGTKFLGAADNEVYESEFEPRFFLNDIDKIEVSGWGLVYCDGKWAELVVETLCVPYGSKIIVDSNITVDGKDIYTISLSQSNNITMTHEDGSVYKDWVTVKEANEFFEDGSWALYTEEKVEKPKITINGCTVEFFSDYVKFGCATIDKEDFTYLYNHIQEFGDNENTNRQINAVTIGVGTFSAGEIEEIAKYYLSLEG